MTFRKAEGLPYLRFLRRLHDRYWFDWYLEIGARKGDSLAPVRGPSIAVDPFFRLTGDVLGSKPALHLFQTTSDAFFQGGALDALGARISFAFLDGMHLFEYLLRDFVNTERHATPDSVIALHDCCPFSHEMTTRDLDNLPQGAWTGDVWKLIPILREYRPDLTLTVLDVSPTGLVLVSGLDPDSTVLAEASDEIVARFMDQTLEGFGLDRFNDLFEFTDARDFARRGFPLFSAIGRDPAQLSRPVPVTP